jgi:hypothetical protein
MVGLKFVKTLEFGGASDCRPMKHVPMEMDYAATRGAIGSKQGKMMKLFLYE